MDTAPVTTRPPFWRRFAVRITALYAIPVFVLLGVMGAFNYRRGVDSEMAALEGRIHSITVALSTSIDPRAGDPVAWTQSDYDALVDRFEAIGRAEPDISSIYVVRLTPEPGMVSFAADYVRPSSPTPAGALNQLYDATQTRRMLTAFTDGPQIEDEIYVDEWGRTLSGYAPILGHDGKAAAIVGCDVTAERVEAIEREVLVTTAALYGLAFAALGGIMLIVGRNVQEPLHRLITVADELGAGRLESRANLDRGDEFGVVAQHFDLMAKGLQEREYIRAIFGRYVSEGVARNVLASPDKAALGGEEREVSIVFSDIRNYSTISERLTPTQVVSMLNEYMGAMGDLVDDDGGVVIEFLGDAVLAVFGAPEHVDDHAERAVRCAMQMDERLQRLNVEWERSGLARLWKEAGVDKLTARVGVHTGRVVAGNMGGPTRVKYAVIGDAVNVASRVEGLNNTLGTRVLVTEATAKRLPPELLARLEARGEHQLKGREQKIGVYTTRDS